MEQEEATITVDSFTTTTDSSSTPAAVTNISSSTSSIFRTIEKNSNKSNNKQNTNNRSMILATTAGTTSIDKTKRKNCSSQEQKQNNNYPITCYTVAPVRGMHQQDEEAQEEEEGGGGSSESFLKKQRTDFSSYTTTNTITNNNNSAPAFIATIKITTACSAQSAAGSTITSSGNNDSNSTTTTVPQDHDDQIHIHDLADEIWFTIIAFLQEEIPWRSMDLCTVFRIFYLVSKKDHARLIKYAKQVPQKFRYAQEDLIQLVWACQHEIKLGRADFRSCDGYSDYILCMHMLRCCNTLDLKILKIRTFWLSNDDLKNRRILKMATKLGLVVSLGCLPPLHHQQGPMSCQQVQSAISCLIVQQVPALRKICIESKTHELDIPLLEYYKYHLVDLTLKLFKWGAGYGSRQEQQLQQQQQQQQHNQNRIQLLDNHLEQVTQVVSLMPKLKKFKINACFPASFRIFSSSLTKIDVRGSMGGFWITECTCPKLKLLRMSYYICKSEWTGAIPLSKEKVQEDLLQGVLNNHGSTAVIQDFEAKKLPCMGLNVPDDCNIKLFLVQDDS